MKKTFSDEELQRRFVTKGYVTKSVLGDEEVSFVLERLGTLRPDDGFSPDGRGINQSTYHCTFLDTNVDYKRRAAALVAEVFDPWIDRLLENYRMLTGNFYVKPPGKGRFEIHQNWQSTADLRDTTLTIWCPLVGVGRSNGTIQVVEGSHKIVPHVAGIHTPPFFKDFEEALRKKYLKPIELAAGECLIFDDSLIHYSDRNDSDQPRYAIQIETLPAESTPILHYLNPDHPERGFELFEVDAEFFVENTVTAFRKRPAGLRSLGYVENRNRPLTEDEFAERLRRGDQIRAELYGRN